MRVLKKDLRGEEGEIALLPESLDDLWHLQHLISRGDLVFALTHRKLPAIADKARPEKMERKTVRLGVKVEDVEFHMYSNWLRVHGIIKSGMDVGQYHTLNIEVGTDLSILKYHWRPDLLARIDEAVAESQRPKVVIALIVTPEGFPLAYEVLSGNTSDKTTLADFLQAIEQQYGTANRTWVMDRGIPTEEVLAEMRAGKQPVSYLVGTPKGRLSKLEESFLQKPWEQVRSEVKVKLLAEDGELYILARSDGRVDKERAMRRRRLKKLWHRLHELQKQNITRDTLLLKIGAAKKEAGRAYSLVKINLPEADEPVNPDTFSFQLRKKKIREVRRREGCYLLRSNLTASDPAMLWRYYIQLTEIEQAFKELKGDLSIRPIYHQTDERIEAHIFVAFMAYCLHVTLKHQARQLAPGLSPRSILEKFSTIQMVDVHLPTTDGRYLILPRYTQPDRDLNILLAQLQLVLPKQPPPKIVAGARYLEQSNVVPTYST